MKDNSPDNFVPAIGYAGNMMTIVTILFLSMVLFVFWIASLSETRQEKPKELKEADRDEQLQEVKA